MTGTGKNPSGNAAPCSMSLDGSPLNSPCLMASEQGGSGTFKPRSDDIEIYEKRRMLVTLAMSPLISTEGWFGNIPA